MSQVQIFARFSGLRSSALALGWAAIGALMPALAVHAEQFDVPGPAGSVAFGQTVVALPNGNFVVTDPERDSAAGAVYLYSADRVLISTLTGSTANDRIGIGGDDGIVVVGNSNFVVLSAQWTNGGAAQAGAVTWVNGVTGLSGAVSSGNSLVGTTAADYVGTGGVVVLSNGNYVVLSPAWNGGAGAVTWGDGGSGISGPVSATNSLIGATANDFVGQKVTALSNGNYVVLSPTWNNDFGAATWGNGISGVKGAVSAGNSLTGSITGDRVGSDATALSNGNYIVVSRDWNNGTPDSHFGAVTWGNGSTGIVGTVSTGNSLYGTTIGDFVGSSHPGPVALSNGNYVVASTEWNNGVEASSFGAVTWGNGSSGTTGAVSETNSLIGSTIGDRIGERLTALSNGNYVVSSPGWDNGVDCVDCGAVTWGSGSTGIAGAVSQGNSLFGTTTGDGVGGFGATALSSGNYVVSSPGWNNGLAGSSFGAATWGNGGSGTAGAVSDTNSLIGTTIGDNVGARAVALSNGNYVVVSFLWNNGVPDSNVGAVTWVNGAGAFAGTVTASNSLIGTSVGDRVGGGGKGGGVIALQNGNYVVPSPSWNGGVGASTWANGSTGSTGIVSAANSLIGSAIGDNLGNGRSRSFSDNNYIVVSPLWNVGSGAVTLASGAFRLKGTIQPWNSVTGGVQAGSLVPSYSPASKKLVVGRPLENIVSVFTMDQVFAGDMES